MDIFDTHAHLEQLSDLSLALREAKDKGVVAIAAMSVDEASMRRVLTIAKESIDVRIYPCLGVHPGLVREEDLQQCIMFIQAHIQAAAGIGEIGLDFWYKWAKESAEVRELQMNFFGAQLDIARQHSKPVIIHSRSASRDCFEISVQKQITKALFHWYNGPIKVLENILDKGYYVSCSPAVGYHQDARAAMMYAPLDRILIETDCPVSYRGQDGLYASQPKDVWITLEALAMLKGLDINHVREVTLRNAFDFFREDKS